LLLPRIQKEDGEDSVKKWRRVAVVRKISPHVVN
jgi:hypothetical protein